MRVAAMAVLIAALRSFTPPALHVCPFHWLTGRPCPFCGLTRAAFELANGHWRTALAFNALSPLAFTMIFAALWKIPGRSRLWTAGLAAFAVYGICRLAWPEAARLWPTMTFADRVAGQ
jgi:hypothetical protein